MTPSGIGLCIPRRRNNRAVFMEGKRTGWLAEARKLKKPAEGRPPITWRYNLLLYGFLSIILIGGSMAFILSMRQFVRLSAGDELIRMIEMAKVRLESSMNNEVTLALKMADSPLIKRYFQNPGDPQLQKTALEEIAGYRRAFASHSVFWVTDVDKAFYFDGDYKYTVDPDDPGTYWYTMTLYETERYNFNINHNRELNITNIWINAPVYDQQKPLGIVGTSMDLFAFNAAYYGDKAGRGSLYFFNKAGEITCAWDAAWGSSYWPGRGRAKKAPGGRYAYSIPPRGKSGWARSRPWAGISPRSCP